MHRVRRSEIIAVTALTLLGGCISDRSTERNVAQISAEVMPIAYEMNPPPRSILDPTKLKSQALAATYAFRVAYSLGCPFHDRVVEAERVTLRMAQATVRPSLALLDTFLTDALEQWCRKERLITKLNGDVCKARLDAAAPEFNRVSSLSEDQGTPTGPNGSILAKALSGTGLACLVREDVISGKETAHLFEGSTNFAFTGAAPAVLERGLIEPQVFWDQCVTGVLATGYYSPSPDSPDPQALLDFVGIRAADIHKDEDIPKDPRDSCKSRKLSAAFAIFLHRTLRTCVQTATEWTRPLRSIEIADYGIAADDQHAEEGHSLHLLNRAIDLAALYVVDADGHEHRYVHILGALKALGHISGDESLLHGQQKFWENLADCFRSRGAGAISWSNPKHLDHLHISLRSTTTEQAGFYGD